MYYFKLQKLCDDEAELQYNHALFYALVALPEKWA